jgi:CheY-like chemotaxis protein
MSKTLLLADDSVVIQKLVGLSFANEDVDIVTTDNGDDAIVKAREITPNVVLADVVMPGKSGYEVCEAIKQDPALAHIPVLLLTGTFEAFDEARAESVGANGQITKPFEARALVERVNDVLNAPAVVVDEPELPPVEQLTSEYDFFDSDVSTLSAEDSSSSISVDTSATDQTPAITADDAHLFGGPGDGATDKLDAHGGGLTLGESVARTDVPQEDATIAILADTPPPLPPSMGDPLLGFEDDLGFDKLSNVPPPIPPTAVDLDSALDAVPSDPDATIVAAVDDTNAATSPNLNLASSRDFAALDDDFDDLTVHTPSSAIDNDFAAAPSPAASKSDPLSGRADATVVANLDVSLAEPVSDFVVTPRRPIDLGPSNVSPEELDFAFDVSEQVPAGDFEDPMEESFSSLMDISESQILAGPSESRSIEMDARAADSIADDSIAAGYDVSSSDLATSAPTPIASDTGGISFGVENPSPVGIEHDAQEPTIDAATELAAAISRSSSAIPPAEPNPDAFDLQGGNESIELREATPPSSIDDRIADLSPMVEQRIQETLEKVAWEAFSDLSESIVKQVIGRVEKIAWEVIPQMAETLVREEIRKMKGEKD